VASSDDQRREGAVALPATDRLVLIVGGGVSCGRGHKNERYCIFSTFCLKGGKFVVGGSEDSKIYVWDLKSRDVVQTLEGRTGANRACRDPCGLSRESWLVLTEFLSWCCASDAVIAVAAHPTRSIIASGGMKEDRRVRLWHIPEDAAQDKAAQGADDMPVDPPN
jgi:WD40 repeat protein